MKHLDLSLASAEENLALDEALLDQAEAGSREEVLRFWSPASVFVVVGYANSIAREVHLDRCRTQGVPVLRRCTGGGTVVQAPGCLNYSLILSCAGALDSITGTNRRVMARNQAVFESLLPTRVSVQGATDLVTENRKFSGNAQRRKRRYLLFHGTVLLNMDLQLITDLLPLPSRQPEYRADRDHARFVANLGLSAAAVKDAFCSVWDAKEPTHTVPREGVARLLEERYGQRSWHDRY